MRRLLKRALFLFVVLSLLAVTWGGYLAATTPRPRTAASWERLPNLPEPRGEVSAAVGARLAGCPQEPCPGDPARLFVLGGLTTAGRVTDLVSLYDPEADEWTSGPPLPEKRHHAAAAGAGGPVYVSGGAEGALRWTPERSLWVLMPDATDWAEAPQMPEGRLGHQMVAIGGTLYVVGGRGETSNVLIYEPRERTWSRGAEMPAPRDHLVAVAVGTKIYAIGGRDEEGLSVRVDIYDTRTDAWREGPALPLPLSAMAGGRLADGIHVVGGEDPATVGGRVIDRHVVLDPRTERWTAASLPVVATHGSGAVVLDGRLVVAGGARRQGLLSLLGWTGIVQAFTPRE